jgi:hypothetical protein
MELWKGNLKQRNSYGTIAIQKSGWNIPCKICTEIEITAEQVIIG